MKFFFVKPSTKIKTVMESHILRHHYFQAKKLENALLCKREKSRLNLLIINSSTSSEQRKERNFTKGNPELAQGQQRDRVNLLNSNQKNLYRSKLLKCGNSVSAIFGNMMVRKCDWCRLRPVLIICNVERYVG